MLPQAPQLLGSLLRSTQTSSHRFWMVVTDTETLVDVASGVVVLKDATSVMEMLVDTLTVIETVEAVTVVVGVGRVRQPQASEMSEHANGQGAPAQTPVAEEVVLVVVVVLVVAVVAVVVDVELDEPPEEPLEQV
jgi:hypothetical protein